MISRKLNIASAKMNLGSAKNRFDVRPVMVCVHAAAEKVIKTSSPSSLGSQTSSVTWK